MIGAVELINRSRKTASPTLENGLNGLGLEPWCGAVLAPSPSNADKFFAAPQYLFYRAPSPALTLQHPHITKKKRRSEDRRQVRIPALRPKWSVLTAAFANKGKFAGRSKFIPQYKEKTFA